MNELLAFSEEVASAKAEGLPLVALESTIISHGMPYPKNRETALAVESQVRASGAIPATMAVMDGRLKIGLSKEEIERLAVSGQSAIKTSRRDLPFVVARKLIGATTVAATMILAELAGIRIFATGGIGGVHRGAYKSFDISADLEELAKTDVAVVCAGAKSILDIALTREYLETRGVAIVGFRCDELPAFYTRESGFTVDWRVDSAIELASVLDAKQRMGIKNALVIANPIPKAAALSKTVIDAAINAAVAEADERGVLGKELTPFLLERIVELSGGRSLEANIHLVLNNARLAAETALACQSYGR